MTRTNTNRLKPKNVLPQEWTRWCIVPLGLLASSGSGLWNAVLGYVLQAKNIAKRDAAKP